MCEHEIFDINQCQKSSSNNEDCSDKKLPGRKPLAGGLSADAFLTLSHTLRCYTDFATHLLSKKRFRQVLPGFSNNNRIEKHFCFMRCLSGMHLALDITIFCQNARTDLFRTMSRLCMNDNGSHSKVAMKYFFKDVLTTINLEEESLIDDSHQKLSILVTLPSNLLSSSMKNPMLPYVSGHTVTKVIKNKNVKCDTYREAISIGIHISDALKELVTHNILCTNERDKVGLTWPSENVIILSAIVFSIFETISSSKNGMKLLMESTSSSRVGLRTIRRIISKKVSECDALKCLNCVCEVCGCCRQAQLCDFLIGTLFNVSANNFTLLMNRRETAKKMSLKMVKMQKQKQMYHSSKTSGIGANDTDEWTGNDCKSFLRLHKGLLTGNIKVLRQRCILLSKLIEHDLQNIISLSVSELRKMCNDLKIQAGTKDELVERVFSVLVNDSNSRGNEMLLIENSIDLDDNL